MMSMGDITNLHVQEIALYAFFGLLILHYILAFLDVRSIAVNNIKKIIHGIIIVLIFVILLFLVPSFLAKM
jgi:hypothetical protein